MITNESIIPPDKSPILVSTSSTVPSPQGDSPPLPSPTYSTSSEDNLLPLQDYKFSVVSATDSSYEKLLSSSWRESAVAGVKIVCEQWHCPRDEEAICALVENDIALSTLESILSTTKKEDQAVMTRTFVAIGKQLMNTGLEIEMYSKRALEDKNRLTHPFVIAHQKVFVIPKGDSLGKGASKVVRAALSLTDPKESFVRQKIKDSHPLSELIHQAQAESDLLKELHEIAHSRGIEGADCLAPPHIFTAITMSASSRSAVLFQKRFQGDGELLRHADTKQQLIAFRDTALAISALHEMGYVHMDVKPKNILLEGDVKSESPIRAKLSDFGNTTSQGKPVTAFTMNYLAPEFRNEAPVNPSYDQFALGVSLFETLLCRLPKVNLGTLKDQKTIDECFRQLQGYIDKKEISAEDRKRQHQMLAVAQQLTRFDPKERISAKEAAYQLSAILK